MICGRNGEDQLLKALVARGINIIIPPRDGIQPGDLIVGDPGGAIRRGDWVQVVGLTISPKADVEPGFVSTTFVVSGLLKASVGVSLVGKAMAALGLTEGSLHAALKSARAASLNIQLIAPAVQQLRNLDEIIAALDGAAARPKDLTGKRRFFVVERVWRAKGLSLECFDASERSVALTGDALQQLKAAAKLNVADRKDGRLSFIADSALIFGVTLRELIFTLEGVTDKPSDQVHQFRGGLIAPGMAFAADEDLLIELSDGG